MRLVISHCMPWPHSRFQTHSTRRSANPVVNENAIRAGSPWPDEVDAAVNRISKPFCMKFNPLDYPILFAQPERRSALSAWEEHIPFGMFLVGVHRPRVIVELGTHAGDSYCAFCQAVSAFDLETRCYAVDTWQGDEHSEL